MSQQGQLVRLKRTGRDGEPLWAYRYRLGGRGSKRVQRGGFASERDAAEALERELERLRRERRVSRSLTPRRIGRGVPRAARRRAGDDREAALAAGKAIAVFGERPVGELRSEEIAAWRIDPLTRLPLRRNAGASPGARAGGRLGHDRRQPGEGRRRQPDAAAQGAAPVRVVGANSTPSPRQLGPRYGRWCSSRPRPGFGRPNGSRSSGATSTVRRVSSTSAARSPSGGSSARRRRRACARCRCRRSRSKRSTGCSRRDGTAARCSRPSEAATSTCTTSATAWQPAQVAAGIEPLRRIYDLRHTFATFALRAGISTFDLSRYMGASLTMIDRHYGHLARDGREHAIRCSTSSARANVHGGRWWTLRGHQTSRSPSAADNGTALKQAEKRSPLTDSNRRPPPYHGGALPTELRGQPAQGTKAFS